MHIVSVLVLIYMIDPSSVERRGAPDNPVDGVAFAQQELGEIGAVLPSDACDKGYAWLKGRRGKGRHSRHFSVGRTGGGEE